MNRRLQYAVVSMSTCLVALLLFGAVRGRSASNDQPYKHLAVFSEVLSKIKSDYVEEPDLKGVTAGALNGLLEAVDPFGSYLSADQFKQYQKNKDAAKGDVGLILARRSGYVSIVSVMPGSSASKNNLSTGDVIEAINGVATRDMPLAYAEMLLRGEPGSAIEVTVLRLRNPEPAKVSLARTAAKYPDVAVKNLDGGILHLQTFSVDSAHVDQVAAKVKDAEKQGAKKVILDLRNCAHGEAADGLRLANLFVESGVMGSLRGQKTAKQDFAADPKVRVSKLPMVVITNRGTAGAAEIAASALIDTKRAEGVGERSYGYAGVQKTITLDDGSALILTVAKYYANSGKAISETGVVPGHPVIDNADLGGDDDEDDPTSPSPAQQQQQQAAKPSEDAPLKKAVEVLSK
jgi:carboxyl-terminal processing protease